MIKAGIFDLERTVQAYALGGNKTHWSDYSIDENNWDEEAYYADFDRWWDNLTENEQKRIYKLIFD